MPAVLLREGITRSCPDEDLAQQMPSPALTVTEALTEAAGQLEGLRDGSLVEPPAVLRDALTLVAGEFHRRCDARLLPGAKLVPAS